MGRKRQKWKIRKRILYPLFGLLLSFSAPIGWLCIQFFQQEPISATHFTSWLPVELENHILLYGYMHAGAVFVLTMTGFALGFRDDKIRQHYLKVVSQRRLLSMKNRQLSRLSITDPLTGLANRARLLDVLNLELRRALRYNSDLCVLVVDVDFFKRINDTYGHIYGDFVLHELGQIFALNRRETDYVARMGGEEFCFVLTQTQIQDALKFGERLRDNVAQYRFEHKGVVIPVNISAGVVSIRDFDPKELDERGNRLYAAADEALYLSKRLGRNRVIRYEHPSARPLTA